MAKITIQDYNYPDTIEYEFLPVIKTPIIIDESDISMAARKGVTWTQLSRYYLCDEDTLKTYFMGLYTKARASFEISMLGAMADVALSGNPVILKWLSANFLGMSDKITSTTIETDPKLLDLAEIDQKLTKLLSKGKK